MRVARGLRGFNALRSTTVRVPLLRSRLRCALLWRRTPTIHINPEVNPHALRDEEGVSDLAHHARPVSAPSRATASEAASSGVRVAYPPGAFALLTRERLGVDEAL